jgi:chromosome segregation ATPase
MSYQREYLEDLRKSRASEDEAREQSELLMQQLQQLEMEKSALLQEQDSDKRVHEELNSQLHKLIGHQNLKQKIQLHASIKEENNKLKQQVQSLNLELRKSETRCKKIDAELRKFNKSVDVDGMLEEDEKLQKAIQLKEKENQHLAASLKDVTSQFNALAQLLLDVEVTSESEFVFVVKLVCKQHI